MSKHVKLHDLKFEPFIKHEQILARVQELGAELSARYTGGCPLFVSILNGSFVFTADLMRAYSGQAEVSFVRLSSYEGTTTKGEVHQVMGLDKQITGRDVILVEDIVDTGSTLLYFLEELAKHNPASVVVVTLLIKPDALRFDIPVDYTGFSISDRFVVGYGLDYDGLGRNLPDIYQLQL
jgi:hypoxanthine phosphoribosyltransferase